MTRVDYLQHPWRLGNAPSLLPYMDAMPSDLVRSQYGFAVHGERDVYSQNGGADADYMLDYLGAGIVRMGQVYALSSTGRTNQRQFALSAFNRGYKAVALCDDQGTTTVLQRVQEALNNWAGMDVIALEPANEPQRPYGQPGAWVVTSHTSTTVQVSGSPWTASALVGNTVTISSGTGRGTTRNITANTTNTITADAAWGSGPDDGVSVIVLGTALSGQWPESIGTNGPTSADTTLGKAECIRQLELLVQARIDAGATSIPIIGHPFSMKDRTDWYLAYNAACQLYSSGHVPISSLVQGGTIHEYPGGQQPDGSNQITNQVTAARNFLGYGTMPLWMTESGYHQGGLTPEVRYNVTSSTSTVITVSGTPWTGVPTGDIIGMNVQIVSGTGAGQSKSVTGASASTITTSAWTTTPDATSVIRLESTHRPASELAHSIYAARYPFEATRAGVGITCNYEMLDEPAQGNNYDLLPEKYFGIFKYVSGTVTPKPAATTFRNLFNLYRDAGVTAPPLQGTIDPPAGGYSALHYRSSDSSWLVALWRPVSIYDFVSWTDLAQPTAVNALITTAASLAATIYIPRLSASPQSTQSAATTHSIPVQADLVVVVLR